MTPQEAIAELDEIAASYEVDGMSRDVKGVDDIIIFIRQQQEEIERKNKALESIAEYWNQSENDRAMSDALFYMIDTAEQALKGDSQEGGGKC